MVDLFIHTGYPWYNAQGVWQLALFLSSQHQSNFSRTQPFQLYKTHFPSEPSPYTPIDVFKRSIK